MTDSGERVIPRESGHWKSMKKYLIYLRHLAVYTYAQPLTANRIVLDLGCGTGYGTQLLAESAAFVGGLDRSLELTWQISSPYDRARFLWADAVYLPFADGTFDLVTSFQVIEHILDTDRYLEEIWRVLADRGILVISTPNKCLRLLPFQPPRNPFHIREYSPKELYTLLSVHFRIVSLQGLHCTPAIRAIELERLKQNPLNVYARLILKAILPRSLIARLKPMRASLASTLTLDPRPAIGNETPDQSSERFGSSFSLADFWVEPSHVESCLDIIAVCTK